MNGRQFIAAVRRIGRVNDVPVRVESGRGKGSHVTLWYGMRFTVVKDRRKDIGRRLLHAMCRQIGLDPRELGRQER